MGVLGAVVYYIRRAVLNVAKVDSLEAATEAGTQRIHSMEEAERDARVKARKETDAKASSVRTADDAAKLLGEAFGDDPNTN